MKIYGFYETLILVWSEGVTIYTQAGVRDSSGRETRQEGPEFTWAVAAASERSHLFCLAHHLHSHTRLP
jgi:hypothetical protein